MKMNIWKWSEIPVLIIDVSTFEQTKEFVIMLSMAAAEILVTRVGVFMTKSSPY